MRDYAAMSDFEINLAVASKFAANWRSFNSCVIGVPSSAQILIGNKWVLFDACNSWADAGPIIIDNKISLQNEIIRWRASALSYHKNYENGFRIFEENSGIDSTTHGALRAAMIVFLMMKDAENEK